jgi:protein farnesyltransferase/geranylgeranyltransferase type-1 subunit alpha
MPRCRNNSAWNQRFYVVSHCGGFTGEVARREVTYTLQKIDLVTRNESAWNYLRVGRIFLWLKGKAVL